MLCVIKVEIICIDIEEEHEPSFTKGNQYDSVFIIVRRSLCSGRCCPKAHLDVASACPLATANNPH